MKLLVFGFGYSVQYVAERLRGTGAEITATVRTPAKAELLMQNGIRARVFSPDHRDHAIAQDIAESEAILVSVPPQPSGDPVLAAFAETILATPKLRWIGYLSTVGVYGDHAGGWVDEATPVAPREGRSRIRAEAEQRGSLFVAARKAVQIFRSRHLWSRRNQLGSFGAAGTARRIVKPGQVFNRASMSPTSPP